MKLSRLREHLGTAGLIVAIVALSVALAGGAIAANGGAGDGKATASAKAKKGPRGPKGPKGDPGPQGPQGPAGPAGAKGDNGSAGSNGSNGSNGATGPTGSAGAAGDDGKSATVTPFDGETEPGGEPCNEFGGLEVEVEDSGELSIVCNGETGFTDVLPQGKTEAGAWAAFVAAEGFSFTPISFNIPLADEPEVDIAPDPDCPGTLGEPKAAEGHLCLYVTEKTAGVTEGPEVSKPDAAGPGALPMGALVYVGGTPGAYAFGTWAVTGASSEL
ncbi:MAG TPA: hypothetical protein VFY48_03005 [Solirubrobacterales bacterium]|nr:hypothetical protein [Solirubrobacterales bacterium]